MSDDLCDMKIKDLRNLAKKKNIEVRDSKGKLKNKCKLIIEIIKKKYSGMNDDEMDLTDFTIETPQPEEMDLTNFTIERPQQKNLRFGKTTEKTIETENKSGKKNKNTSRTRRTLSEKEIENFIPSKISSTKFKKMEDEKKQNEINSMSIEDENILSNDYPKYKMIKIKNNSSGKSAYLAKLKSETDKSEFKIFEIDNFIDTKNFKLKSENPIGIFSAKTKKIIEEYNKSALDRVFKKI